jgi:hypothetical protein
MRVALVTRPSRVAGALLIAASICGAQPLSDFAGAWVSKAQGRAVLSLELVVKGGEITGRLRLPQKLSVNGDSITAEGRVITRLVERAQLEDGRLALTIHGRQYRMEIVRSGAATLAPEGVPPIRMQRASSARVRSIPQPKYSREIVALREHVKKMVAEEQAARLAFDDKRTIAADEANRQEVLRVFEKYGWPRSSRIGADAAHEYWLLVQHQEPEIQRRMLPELEKAAKAGEASMSDYAYLYDRVQMGLGKPQRWGSQVKCEGGKPVLYTVEDPAGLDARRKELFMMPIGEYLSNEYLLKSCAEH